MGLLSDASKQRKFSILVINHYHKAIVIGYIVGILWFLALASEQLNNKVYFSENALLPGLVVRDFNPGSSLSLLHENLKEEAKDHSSLPFAWIQGQFRQIGLDVYNHNFTLHYPFGSKPKYKGINIYAILRAPKSSSIEALVLSTPYRGPDSLYDSTLPSVVLMIELARYFRKHTFWSKDIIFLITEHEMVGFQAWLEAYHNKPVSRSIESGSLIGYSGLIQGVINLEISSEKFTSIDIKIEGLNGQLPNLDLFNLAVELCAREGISATFQSRDYFYSQSFIVEAWQHDVKTMLSMMALQSTGLTNGGHGLFHRYGIQAITLMSVNKGSVVSTVHLGRVLEGIFRSLNNLLEKFHQSFFFYLLPSIRRYVSIGLYMPPFFLLASPVLVRALYLYLVSKFTVLKLEDFSKVETTNLWSALDIVIVSHVLGIILYFNLSYIEYFQTLMRGFSTEDTIYYLHIIVLVLSLLFTCVYCRSQTLVIQEYHIKYCVSLLELGAFLYILALVNISMATALAVIYVPISVTFKFKSKLRIIHTVLLLFIHPFILTYLVVTLHSIFNGDSSVWHKSVLNGITAHKKILLFTVEDMYLFNNWNYKMITLVLQPLWYQLWMVDVFKHS